MYFNYKKFHSIVMLAACNHRLEKDPCNHRLFSIRERPCLFDKSLSDYHDKIVRENAMEDIAFILNDSVEDCEKKLKQFQAAYYKEKLLQEQENRSGAPASKRRKWPYFEQMNSLIPQNIGRLSLTTISKSCANEKNKKRQPNASFSAVNKRKIDPIESAMNNIQATIHNVVSAVNNAESSVPEIPEILDDVDALVRKLIAVRLNQMSPITAKKKRKLIMQCLIDQDSDSDIKIMLLLSSLNL